MTPWMIHVLYMTLFMLLEVAFRRCLKSPSTSDPVGSLFPLLLPSPRSTRPSMAPALSMLRPREPLVRIVRRVLWQTLERLSVHRGAGIDDVLRDLTALHFRLAGDPTHLAASLPTLRQLQARAASAVLPQVSSEMTALCTAIEALAAPPQQGLCRPKQRAIPLFPAAA
ncbi:hypothetical protein SDRG_16813 [Saprolegnia diclina VS20]|uniref:Uncharacterized protein n=1 Tax=Saprolegnia diclina (strain VS20) TaxID=1156394 RepID=T0R746_SAPDV|nr:hypothetical protein SDRG_16813 [Saprolegnia diclina VS20]EQC25317.1 hypothetical protein SDRG_16813 [Saprolegnia diclina VS20]|eukprot:XP_008621255.1 hypothetical protein SDRG_16813 [Saprolegnia diclina VS20]